jgi:pimeloyl-ACP methyl ester carboxylesterase
LRDGGKDLYIQQDKFPTAFAADVAVADAKLMAGTRPITEVAGGKASGPPAWKSIPSCFIYGTSNRAIPEAAHAFMAKRAGTRETVAVDGASHVVMVSHPHEVAEVIEHATIRGERRTPPLQQP